MMNQVLIYSDGASRGNPGKSAYAFIITDADNNILYQSKKCIDIHTNNEAEYTALINALKKAEEYTKNEVKCYSDSEIMIKQLNKQYAVRSANLKKLYEEVKVQESKFKKVNYTHVRRTNPMIQKTDCLANQALDSLKEQ